VLFRHPDGRSYEVGGFQPFEAYDTALANLDSSLERRPPPGDVAEAVLFYDHGVTTAEVASVMRAELEDPDLPGTEQQLIAAADEGRITCRGAGGDAIWLPPPSATGTRPYEAAA
jgi:hypothetical protein